MFDRDRIVMIIRYVADEKGGGDDCESFSSVLVVTSDFSMKN